MDELDISSVAHNKTGEKSQPASRNALSRNSNGSKAEAGGRNSQLAKNK